MADNMTGDPARVIEDVLHVSDADSVAWDDAADVIVVGYGAAGATAALQARDDGADVLLLDRFEGGGATFFSGGIYYAGNTRFQRDAGVQDSAENMFNYLAQEVGDAASLATLRKFCNDSAENIEWLVARGVNFEGSLYSGKTTFPPEDKYLYYSGNEKVPAYAQKAKPAARGHRVKGKGWTGYKFVEGLMNSVAASNIRVKTHTRVMRLVMDKAGRVLGVEALTLPSAADRARHMALYQKVSPRALFAGKKIEKAIADAYALEAVAGTRMRLRARGGVVLATGGYAYNVPMFSPQFPLLGRHHKELVRLGSMGCNGSGIQLGVSAGGKLVKAERKFLGRNLSPPPAQVKGLMVNARGERFINEDIYTSSLGEAILDQPDGVAWLILDNETYKAAFRQALPNKDGTFMAFGLPALLNFFFGGTKKARSLAALARKCGLPPGALEKTVAEANAAAASGAPDPLGKNKEYKHVLGAGPYRAINNSISNPFCFFMFFTLGGLHVDEATGAVLRPDGNPIPGLYAAGRTAMGLCSNGYLSGMSLADCVFSGRRAGHDAAMAVHAHVKPLTAARSG